MKTFKKAGLGLICLVGLPATVVAATPDAGINFGGNIELDHNATDRDPADMVYSQTGRVKLQIDGRRDHGDYFVAGKGELLLINDGTTATEDAWIMIGHTKAWNVRMGHFENSHVFPEGRDTVITHATAPSAGNAPVPYEMDVVRGRFDGGLRLRVQSVDNWLFELGTRYGGDGNDQDVFSGFRPVAIYENDGFALRIGAEVSDNGLTMGTAGAEDMSGFGVSVGFSGININVTTLDDKANALKSTTIGANVSLGALVIGAYAVDTDYDAGNDPTLTTIYANYSHGILGIETLAMTYGISASSSDDLVAGATGDQVTDAKVRVNYTF